MAAWHIIVFIWSMGALITFAFLCYTLLLSGRFEQEKVVSLTDILIIIAFCIFSFIGLIVAMIIWYDDN